MPGDGAGCRELACRCLVLVPASGSEVITTAVLTVKGAKPPLVGVNSDKPPLLTLKCRHVPAVSPMIVP